MSTARDEDEMSSSAPPADRDGRALEALIEQPPAMGEFGFDFDTFARSEAEAQADAAVRAPQRAAEATAAAPERRAIVPRNWLAPGDSVVETRPVGNMTIVTLRGRVNETFRGVELGQSLNGVVIFDLSQVDRISSFGVKGWLQMLEHARFTTCYFFRCSEAVINQITMMRNFCGPGRIHSLLVPYQCEACGEEFSAVYEAVPDREAILGRSPVLVECPRCASSSKIADDPWTYLAIDDHLLQDVPADLEQVLEHATQLHRIDPIEKFVSEDETRIRINAPIDARLRLSRALTGLEGRVSFDLTPRPDLSPIGVQRLLDAIGELESEVTEVWIDGASKPLIEALLAKSPPRTYISTAWVTAFVSETGIHRPVLIDVRKKRAALVRGQMPAVEATWAHSSLTFEDEDVVFSAARNLLPRVVTPLPAPLASPPPTSTSAQSTSATPKPTLASPTPLASYGAAPSTSPPPRPPKIQRRARTWIWQFVAFGATTALLAGITFTTVFYLIYRGFSPQVADQSRPVASSVESAPPEWIHQPLTVDATAIRWIGIGQGETPELAARRARLVALYRLVQHVREKLDQDPVSGALGIDPGDTQAEAIANQLLTDVGTWATPKQTNQAVLKEASGYRVAIQQELDGVILDRVVSYYRQAEPFRGIVVGRRFPFSGGSSRVVVLKAESWFTGVAPGDPVIQVGNLPVVTLEDFLRIHPMVWEATPAGGTLSMWIEHGGKRSHLDFVRTPTKNNSKIELLPLELPQ